MKGLLGGVIGGIFGFTCGLIASMLPCVADAAGFAAAPPSGDGSSGPIRPQPAAVSVATTAMTTRRPCGRDTLLRNTSDSELNRHYIATKLRGEDDRCICLDQFTFLTQAEFTLRDKRATVSSLRAQFPFIGLREPEARRSSLVRRLSLQGGISSDCHRMPALSFGRKRSAQI